MCCASLSLSPSAWVFLSRSLPAKSHLSINLSIKSSVSCFSLAFCQLKIITLLCSCYKKAKIHVKIQKCATILAKNPWNTPFPCAKLRWHFNVSLATTTWHFSVSLATTTWHFSVSLATTTWHFSVSLATTTLQEGGGRKWCENVQSVSRFLSKIVAFLSFFMEGISLGCYTFLVLSEQSRRMKLRLLWQVQ